MLESRALISIQLRNQEEQRLSYGQLDAQARVIAAYLQAMGMPGERALLLYPR
jgi:Acyl-CoA synthetases (AMP-forming)/AMP-acid ligases II